MKRFRLPIFAGNQVEFHGFEACALEHMQELLLANGGTVASSPAQRTHLVVDEHSVEALPASLQVAEGCHLVKGGWFWRSIEIDAAAKVANHGWKSGQKISSASTQIGDQIKVQVSYLEWWHSVTAEKEEEGLNVVEQCAEVVNMLVDQVVESHHSPLADAHQANTKQSDKANSKAISEEIEVSGNSEEEEKQIATATQVISPDTPEKVIAPDTPEKTQRDDLEETLGVFPTGCHDFTFEDTHPEKILQTQENILEKAPALISSLESVDIRKDKEHIPEECECKATEGLCVILFCWFGVVLNAMEAAAARFANPKLNKVLRLG